MINITEILLYKYRDWMGLKISKKLGHSKNTIQHYLSVYGILIDAAWLWEEYLAKILKEKFLHCTKNSNWSYLFENNIQKIITDYRSDCAVADAKYISLDSNNTFNEEKATAIYYKSIAYMVRFNKSICFLFYPTKKPIAEEILKIKENNCWTIIKIGLNIPKVSDLINFVNSIKTSENNLMNLIDKYT